MIEFNPDGSIKMPSKMAEIKAKENSRMNNARCLKVRKELVSTKSPKACALHLTLSEAISDNTFIRNIFADWSSSCQVPAKLLQEGPKEFRIEIGTDFRRCSDCTALIGRYRMFLDSNVIEQKGGCEYGQKRSANFSYEDYFD